MKKILFVFLLLIIFSKTNIGQQLHYPFLNSDQAGMVSPISQSNRIWSYDNFWTSTTATTYNSFTNVGLTAALSSNKLQITGNGNNYLQYYYNKNYSYIENFKIEDTVVMNSSVSSTSYGIGIGVGTFPSNNFLNLGYVDLSTGGNAGKCFIVTDSASVAVSSTAITFASGDRIVLRLQMYQDTIAFTVSDLTTSTSCTTTAILSAAFIYPQGTNLLHKIGNYAIFVKGGQYTINAQKITDNEPLNMAVAGIGDSKLQGYFVGANNINRRVINQINDKYAPSADYSSSGDAVVNVLTRINDVINAHPQYAIVEIGSNDVRQGATALAAFSSLQSLTGLLEGNGISVLQLTAPETGTPTVAYKLFQLDSLVRANYPNNYLPVYDKIAANTGLLAPDGIHWSAQLNDSIYTWIVGSGLLTQRKYVPSFTTTNLNGLSTDYLKNQYNIISNGGNKFTSPTTFTIGTVGSLISPTIISNGKKIAVFNSGNFVNNIEGYRYDGTNKVLAIRGDSLSNNVFGVSAFSFASTSSNCNNVGTSGLTSVASGSFNNNFGNFGMAFLGTTGHNNNNFGYRSLYGFHTSTTVSTFNFCQNFGDNNLAFINDAADSNIVFGFNIGNNPSFTNAAGFTGHGNMIFSFNDSFPASNTSDWLNIGHYGIVGLVVNTSGKKFVINGSASSVFDSTLKISGSLNVVGNALIQGALNVSEGAAGRVGQVSLVSGTKAIAISGLTTSSRAFVQLVSPSGVSLTVQYQAVCTSNTLTIQANIAAGTINTSDGSTLNYFIIN